MSKHRSLQFLVPLIISVSSASIHAGAGESKFPGEPQFPVIKNYGPAYNVPNAFALPEKGLPYKVIFDITKTSPTQDAVNPGVAHTARFLNLLESAGFPVKEAKIAVVFHGEAGVDVLKDEFYQKLKGRPNPNTALIGQLKNNGVELIICGQTLADKKFELDWVNPDMKVALSALIVLSTYQLKGYAWLPF